MLRTLQTYHSLGVGVGVASIGDGCASWADSGVNINDLGGVDDCVVGVPVGSRDGGCGSKDDGGRCETHVD